MVRCRVDSDVWRCLRTVLQRAILPALAPMMLLFAGCMTATGYPCSAGAVPEPLFYVPYPASVVAPPAAESNKADTCPPKPRTICEALCAYCQCLRYGPPPKEVEKKKEEKTDTENKGKKNEPSKADDKAKQETEKKQDAQDMAKDNDQAKDSGQDKDKENGKDNEKELDVAWYSAHAQATVVTQAHSNFSPPYTGPNSLLPSEGMATSITSTLFLDARLWEGGELVFNPEIAGGTGFSNVEGIAGFPNGEITRVGLVEPTWFFARLYLQQTIGLGGEQEDVKDDPNQIAGKRDIDRITIRIGRFAATDVVDDNRYAHDPRSQFLNWGLMYNGAWDYPSNVRGYDDGVAIDFNTKWWALHYGIVAEPTVANGAALDPHILKAHGQFLELEERYDWCEHPGKLRWLAYMNNAHMGNYREALEEQPVDPNVTLTRAYRVKYGFGLNWEQEVTKDLGVFSRLGWNNDQAEAWAFTPIGETASLGTVLKGTRWCRPNDEIGLAGEINGISDVHREYLAAGGLDFNIGDGRLNYRPEEIMELYYLFEIHKGIEFTVDFQEVNNLAYNHDRGPVSVGSMRLHLEY